MVGPLQYSVGYKYLLTCVDRFNRWPEAIPLVDIKAKTVADAFFSGWIARFGTPATITTDRVTQFESRLGDNLRYQFGIIIKPYMHTNHRIHGVLRYPQCYSAIDPL